MAGVTVGFATEEFVAGYLVGGKRSAVMPGKFLFRNRTSAVSVASISVRDIVVNRNRYVVLRYQILKLTENLRLKEGDCW